MLRHCSGDGRKRERERDAPRVSKSPKITEHGGSSPEVSPALDGRPKAIFILEGAAVKKTLVKRKWRILSSEENADILRRQKKNLDDYRPEILFEALRGIHDSPLYKAGMVGAIYVKIKDGALFEVKTHVRLPRTLKRFCGIMLELLEKSCVCTKDTHETLLRVIKEPVNQYIPANSRIIGGLSYNSEKVVNIEDYVSAASDDLNLVFVVGVMVRGEVDKQYADDYISVVYLESTDFTTSPPSVSSYSTVPTLLPLPQTFLMFDPRHFRAISFFVVVIEESERISAESNTVYQCQRCVWAGRVNTGTFSGRQVSSRPALMAKRNQELKRKAGDGNVNGEGDLTTKRRQNSLVLQPCSGKELEHVVGYTKDSEERQEYILDPVELEMQKKVDELPGIPLVPSNHNKEPGVIFVLEKASLVPAYVGRKYQILNPDEQAEFLLKKKLNPYDYRPDIIHEIIGGEAGVGGGSIGVYRQSQSGVTAEVSIKARGRGGKLLRLVENPVSKHLPVSSHKIGLSVNSRRAVPLRDYFNTISNDITLVFVVGAMAHGKIDSDYTDDFIS
ncbi:hypothetical protein RJ639_016629, partial [Escallonia herrerae]